MRWTSGLLVVIALAMACRIIVLPALGGETMRPRWPLPIGATRSMTRVGQVAGLGLQAQPLLRVERGQLVELGAVARASPGRPPLTVSSRTSALNFVARWLLALARLPDGAGDGVALAQAVLLDLGERDVDVVRAGQVAGGADEGVVVEDVEDAGDGHEDVVLADVGLGLAVACRCARPPLARRSAVAAAPRRRRRPPSSSSSSSRSACPGRAWPPRSAVLAALVAAGGLAAALLAVLAVAVAAGGPVALAAARSRCRPLVALAALAGARAVAGRRASARSWRSACWPLGRCVALAAAARCRGRWPRRLGDGRRSRRPAALRARCALAGARAAAGASRRAPAV